MNDQLQEKLRSLKLPDHLELQPTIEATEDDLVQLILSERREAQTEILEKVKKLGITLDYDTENPGNPEVPQEKWVDVDNIDAMIAELTPEGEHE